MTNTDNFIFQLVLIVFTLLTSSCFVRKVKKEVISVKEYKSFSIDVDEYVITSKELLMKLDDFILYLDNCKEVLTDNDRPTIYIQINEFERGNSVRLGFTAKTSYSVLFDIDENMNSVVELNFKPTAMAKYGNYYISFGSYLSGDASGYLMTKLDYLGDDIKYIGRALVDEADDWVLDDSGKVERVYEIKDENTLLWLFDINCNE